MIGPDHCHDPFDRNKQKGGKHKYINMMQIFEGKKYTNYTRSKAKIGENVKILAKKDIPEHASERCIFLP